MGKVTRTNAQESTSPVASIARAGPFRSYRVRPSTQFTSSTSEYQHLLRTI